MDDGGKSVYNQTILHTRAFKLEDVKYIQSVLLENFSLITRPPSPLRGGREADKVRRKEKRSVSYIYPCKTKN